jgi:hypothetical protein
VGGTFAYLAIEAANNPYAVTAIFVAWVFFSSVIFSTAPLIFVGATVAATLGFYASPEDTFGAISRSLIANTISILILVGVSGLFWILVLSQRPRLFQALSTLLRSVAVRPALDRLKGGQSGSKLPELKEKMKLVNSLWKELEDEPSFVSLPHPSNTEQLLDALASLGTTLKLLDFQTDSVSGFVVDLGSILSLDFMWSLEEFSALVEQHFACSARQVCSLAAGAPALEPTVSSKSLREAYHEIEIALVTSISHADPQEKCLMASRAIVRLVSCVVLLEQVVEDSEAVRLALSEVIVSVRAKILGRRKKGERLK